MAWYRIFIRNLESGNTYGQNLSEREVFELYPLEAHKIMSSTRHSFVKNNAKTLTRRHLVAPLPA